MKQTLNGKLIIPLASLAGSNPARRTPHNPRTLAQQLQRSYVAAASAHWRELTDEAREAWRALGRQLRGQLSGHSAYVKLNVTLARCGLPQAELPPALPAFGLLNCAGLLADDTPQLRLLEVSSTSMPGNSPVSVDRFIIDATGPVSAGIQNAHRGYRGLVVVPGPGPEPANVDLTAAYTAKYGRPRPGQRIFLRLTLVGNGFKGPQLELSTLVANHVG